MSVVLVQACQQADGQGQCSMGSGSLVADGGHVLTNHHVVYDDNSGRPYPRIAVSFAASFSITPDRHIWAQIVDADQGRDIAVLSFDRSMAPDGVAPIAIPDRLRLPRLGEEITILGYPLDGGHQITLTKGVFSGVMNDETAPAAAGFSFWKTDAEITHGNSGGAAFGEDGSFVGIPTAGIDDVGLLIPAGEALRFLKDATGF